MLLLGIEPAIPRFPVGASNHSAKLTVKNLLLKLVNYIEISINACDKARFNNKKYGSGIYHDK